MLALLFLITSASAIDGPFERCNHLGFDSETCLTVTMADQWLWNSETNALVCFDSFLRGGMENPDDICAEYSDFDEYLGIKPGQTI